MVKAGLSQPPHPGPLRKGEGEENERIAVLALQGDFAAHRKRLAEMGIESFEARKPEEIRGAAGLVIPGGESTTFWKFFEAGPWEKEIRDFAATGRPVLGTCAGAIGLIDIGVERNAYGRQVDSFVGEIDAPELGGALPAVFIRAPRIRRVGRNVEVLGTREGEPVLVAQENVIAATFHPELTSDTTVHDLAFGARRLARRSA
jgi:5'-phosphate synthase pdxT subunit